MSASPSIPKNKSNLGPILLTIACGIVLAAGSCFGYVEAALSADANLMLTLGAAGFAIGLAMFLFGCIRAIIVFYHWFKEAR